MESVKIYPELAYKVKDTNGKDTFVVWKANGCEVFWDREMLRLEYDGTAEERSEFRADIFNALQKAQQKMRESGKKESQRTVILEKQIPSSRCGLIIGTDGETIKKIKADSGVQSLYIDTTGRQKVNREPRPNFSWLVICTSEIERMGTALDQVEELLEYADKMDHGMGPMGRRNGGGGGMDEEEGQRMAVVKLRIPAADFFSREQTRQFEQIKKKAHGVRFDLASSDPGQSFRSVTLSGAQKSISSVRMEVNALIDEVKASMPSAEHGKKNCASNDNFVEYPSPPTEPSGSFGCTKIRRETNGKRAPSGGTPTDPVQPTKRAGDRFKREVLVPQKCIVHVIGNGGENIRQLQEKFGVKMQFLGNNYLDYPNGRTLAISGDSEERVAHARDHVDKEFILKKWEAWNTYQHDSVSAEATCEEIYHLSPNFALREDLESAMKEMKDQSGIASYWYRQFCTGRRPIVLQGTEMAVQKATKILAKMEQEWSQPRTMAQSRAPSLGELSISSFVESLSKLNISQAFGELADECEEEQPKEEGKLEEQRDGVPEAAAAANGGDIGGTGEDSTDQQQKQDTLDGSEANALDNFSDGTAGSNQMEKPLNGIQQLLLNNAKDAFKKMNIIMASKDAHIEQLRDRVSRILCTECGQSERSVLFTPCRHFLCCQSCADSVQNCPICKTPSRKFTVYLD